MKIDFKYKVECYDTIEGDTFDECMGKFEKLHPSAQEVTHSTDYR